jgi:hypothetical protein
MAHEWITSATALRYLSDQPYTYNEQRLICERAHSGVIAAMAETLLWQGKEQSRCLVPKEFWRAAGEDPFIQNWTTGDFSTWIDQTIEAQAFEARAFGVSFDFPPLTDLVPAEQRADAMQRISVSGDPQWIRADDLCRLIYQRMTTQRAGNVIIEACALGQLAARAMRVSASVTNTSGYGGGREWAAIEWDVPLWFWRDFLKPSQSTHDWSHNKLKGRGVRNKHSETIELQGLYFHRSGLSPLGLSDPEIDAVPQTGSARGRKPTYDWPSATLAIFGQIHRGDFKPDNQADVEKRLQTHLAKGDKEPSESTVRPFAKLIWEESQKA